MWGTKKYICLQLSRKSQKLLCFFLCCWGVCGTLIYLTRLRVISPLSCQIPNIYDMQMTGSWQCWRDIYVSAGGRVGAFNDCVALSTLAHISLFFHLWHIARSCRRCVVSLNLFTLTTAICGPCGMQRGARRQTPADNSWLCLMSNWHYNGCPHSRWNSPSLSLSLTLCSECNEPAGSKSRGHNWNASATSPPIRFDLSWTGNYAAILLSYFLDSWVGDKGGRKELLSLYEVIAIIVAHTQQSWINTITMQHLVWRRFPLPFLPPFMLKINAIYCCPFAKKESRKREKKSGKLHNPNACVINFKRNKKWSAKKII